MIKAAEAINTFPKEEEQIFVLTSSQLTALMGQAVEKAIQPLKDKLSELEDMNALRALEIGQDRQRIARLEHPPASREPKILDELYKEMVAIGRKQADFATAARLVGRSKARLLQLKPAIAQDMRFVLMPSESHRQKFIIRLRG